MKAVQLQGVERLSPFMRWILSSNILIRAENALAQFRSAQSLAFGVDFRRAADFGLVFVETVALELQPPSPARAVRRGGETAPVEASRPLLAWIARLPAAIDLPELMLPSCAARMLCQSDFSKPSGAWSC